MLLRIKLNLCNTWYSYKHLLFNNQIIRADLISFLYLRLKFFIYFFLLKNHFYIEVY